MKDNIIDSVNVSKCENFIDFRFVDETRYQDVPYEKISMEDLPPALRTNDKGENKERYLSLIRKNLCSASCGHAKVTLIVLLRS